MIEEFADLETLMRGGAAGVSLLLAITLGAYGQRSQTSLLAALFCVSTSIYVLISGAAMVPLPSPVLVPLAVVAIWGPFFSGGLALRYLTTISAGAGGGSRRWF